MAWYTRKNLFAEYKAVASLQTSTVNLRFVTLGVFAALNGFLMTAYGFFLVNPLGFSKPLLTGIATLIILANIAFLFLEWRISVSHALILDRGRDVELGLSIENGVITQSVAARGRVISHATTLRWMYLGTACVGALCITLAWIWPAPVKEKEELAIAVKAAITQEIGQLRQQLAPELKGLSDQIAAEGKKTSREIQTLRERLTRMERRLPKK